MTGSSTSYVDDYPTCFETYATLLAYHDSESPGVVTDHLNLEPSSMTVRGRSDRFREGKRRASELPPSRINGWHLTSNGHVDSRDSLRHIDWLLSRIETQDDAIADLIGEGWSLKLSVFWVSHAGHGGPRLSPETLHRLGVLGISLEFDFYDGQSDDPKEPGEA